MESETCHDTLSAAGGVRKPLNLCRGGLGALRWGPRWPAPRWGPSLTLNLAQHRWSRFSFTFSLSLKDSLAKHSSALESIGYTWVAVWSHAAMVAKNLKRATRRAGEKIFLGKTPHLFSPGLHIRTKICTWVHSGEILLRTVVTSRSICQMDPFYAGAGILISQSVYRGQKQNGSFQILSRNMLYCL